MHLLKKSLGMNISDVTVHGYLVLVGGEVVLACQFQVVVAREHAYGLGVSTLVHQSGNLTLPQRIELLVDGRQAAAQLVQSSPADITHVHIHYITNTLYRVDTCI